MENFVGLFTRFVKDVLVLMSVLVTVLKRLAGKLKLPPIPESAETPPEPLPIYGSEEYVARGIPDLVYVIDYSCSMHSQWQSFTGTNGQQTLGYRMDRARSEAARMIEGMGEETRFDVVAHACTWRTCFEQPVHATQANKEAAIAWIEELEVAGTTATGPALAWALETYECDTFVLITDSAPNTLKSGSEVVDWKTHAGIIAEANKRGATIHVLVVAPTNEERVNFARVVAAQNGPGRVWVVDADAEILDEHTEGLK